MMTPRTRESPRELVRQSEAKRKQARKMCADDENAIWKQPPLVIVQNTQQRTEQPTQIRS